MRYRTSTDIVSQILETAISGCNEATIMYKVFLNHKDLKAYITFLVDWGLVQELQEVESYRTSAKGRKFLADYKQADQNALHPKRTVMQMPIFGHKISS